MRIIIDSNVIFSALIRDSTTRKLILEYDKKFIFPEFVFEEIRAHKSELLKKSGMNKEEFEELVELLLGKIEVVGIEKIRAYKEEAIGLVENIDEDDAIFVACVLAYENLILWTDDKALKRVKKIRVVNIREIIDMFRG